jgi:spermidine synthase
MHGITIHGYQRFAPGRRDDPLSYYTRQGPIGQVFAARRSRLDDVAVIGLGAGSIAAYGRAGDRYTFYEIDPAVARIASDRRLFTFLADSKADVRIVIGDGRLELVSARPRAYDLIVLDAFSSDAVPVHLLTRQAVDLYLRKLAPGGILALHISNMHLDLEPVVAGVARSLGLAGLSQAHAVTAEQQDRGATPSQWVVLARDKSAFGRMAGDPRWNALSVDEDQPVWTDEYSNVLSVIDWSRH